MKKIFNSLRKQITFIIIMNVISIIISILKYFHVLNIDKKLIFYFVLVNIVILYMWIFYIIKKINKLKREIKNIENDNYESKESFSIIEDEIYYIYNKIVKLKNSVREKKQIDKNISFEEEKIVQNKVLDELKISNFSKNENINIYTTLNKYSYAKQKELKEECKIEIIEFICSKFIELEKRFMLDIDTNLKRLEVCGNTEIWNYILDNIILNFKTYTRTKIKITIRKNKIIFYNDGVQLPDIVLNEIFEPYKKYNSNGVGLGLTICKKALNILGYEIGVKNANKGVEFYIDL